MVPEGRDMWLRSEGTLDAGSFALLAGPTIGRGRDLPRRRRAHRVPIVGGVPQYRGYLLPQDGGAVPLT